LQFIWINSFILLSDQATEAKSIYISPKTEYCKLLYIINYCKLSIVPVELWIILQYSVLGDM